MDKGKKKMNGQTPNRFPSQRKNGDNEERKTKMSGNHSDVSSIFQKHRKETDSFWTALWWIGSGQRYVSVCAWNVLSNDGPLNWPSIFLSFYDDFSHKRWGSSPYIGERPSFEKYHKVIRSFLIRYQTCGDYTLRLLYSDNYSKRKRKKEKKRGLYGDRAMTSLLWTRSQNRFVCLLPINHHPISHFGACAVE